MSFRRPRAILEGKAPSRRRAIPAPAVTVAGPAIALMNPMLPRVAPPVAAPVADAMEVAGAGQPSVIIGSALLSFFLFVYFSRLLDITSRLTLPLHIPMFLILVLLVLALAAGGVRVLAASRIGVLETAFVIWVGVATAFSSWRFGSVKVYRDCLYSAMVFFVILALVRNMAQLQRAARAMALAGLTAAIFSFFFTQDMRGGRIAVDIGTLADPNEYALILLMTLPYWWLVAQNAKARGLAGLLSLAAGVPILIAFFRAGSRAGLLTLVGLTAAVFFRAGGKQRILLVLCALVMAAAAVVALPSDLRERYLTWFSTGGDRNLSADVDSTMARRYFLTQSIKLTFEHPLLGVGPGQFAGLNWEISKGEGKNIAAQPTHNTYTEVSSETGIPGLLLFAGMLVISCRSALRIAKLASGRQSLQPLSNAASCIFVSITAFLVGSFFLSLSYSAIVTVALGLSAALQNVARNEFGIDPQARARPQVIGWTA